MTKKTDPQDPGAVPGEKRTRRPALPLDDRAAKMVRKVADYTGQSVTSVLETLAAGDGLAKYVERACFGLAEQHDAARTAERNRLFAPPEPPAAPPAVPEGAS